MNTSYRPIISLEINEVNFDYIKVYISKGLLPNFAKLIDRYKLFETVAEKEFPYLEPWIQWPTVYTGKTYAEHGIFRLGDVVSTDHSQIWDELEKKSLTVGAISPMNAANRCVNPAFFIPDPWTETKVTGSASMKSFYEVVKYVVNRNSSGRISSGKVLSFARHMLANMRPASLGQYLQLMQLGARFKWAKAILLDRLLADILISAVGKHRIDYCSIFLNAGAHIQHHHLYESPVYQGELDNPEWYSDARNHKVDPVLEVYKAYDLILKDFMALPDTRLLITTGLSQKPNSKQIFQYRFIEHARIVKLLGITDAEVLPRMSRDFLLSFPTAEAASRAQALLSQVTCAGEPMIDVENRKDSLFCKICYFGPPEALKAVSFHGTTHDLSDDIVLVSIENGIHQTKGFHFDTAFENAPNAATPEARVETIELKSIYDKTLAAFA